MGLRRPIAVLLAGCAVTAGATACGDVGDEPDLVAGKQQFAEKCSSCHTLARAGAKGVSGPNLDEAFRQALADGMGRSGIEGAVHDQIDEPARLPKSSPVYMPPDLVTGDAARDVAAYVARSVAAGGEDTGLLATAVKAPGGGKPAVEQNGELTIEATPQLAYVTDRATAKPGPVTVKSPNPSSVPHNIALEGGGLNEIGEVVQDGGVSEVQAELKAGEYTFFCSVPGHREGGMEGTLTVK